MSSGGLKVTAVLLVVLIFTFLGVIFHKQNNISKNSHSAVPITPAQLSQFQHKNTHKFDQIVLPTQPKAVHEVVSIHSTSKYAYVTLMHGIDESFKYRGYFYNALLAKQSLRTLGSTADFIVMIGFANGIDPNNENINKDLQTLRDYEIIIHYLPRLRDITPTKVPKVDFMEMALLKITPFSFTQYESIQFLDGDVLPYKNMDCLFTLDINTYNTGNASPLNSGWFLLHPNMADFVTMKTLAKYRLTHKWNEIKGWGTEIPPKLHFKGGVREVKKWDFNGASLDQGLMTHYFILNNGRAQLLDGKTARIYTSQFKHTVQPVQDVLHTCVRGERGGGEGVTVEGMFYHYTGQRKPWYKSQDLRNPKDKSLKLWAVLLDSLNMTLNSQNIHKYDLSAPMGDWAPNK